MSHRRLRLPVAPCHPSILEATVFHVLPFFKGLGEHRGFGSTRGVNYDKLN